MTTTPTAIITGGAQRIGAAIAMSLHTSGYRLVLHYRNSATAAELLADRLNRKRAVSAIVCQADFLNETGVNLVNDALATFGRLDLLVNNASEFFATPIGAIETQDWDRLFASNAKGPLFLSQSAAPHLAKSKGAIVNIIDIHARRPMVGHTVYSMAKAALHMLTLSLARELAPQVRVNGVAPGAILWPEADVERDRRALLKRIPLGRQGEPDDIAEAVLFLARARYVTGQILSVDGGRSLYM